jgi:peptidyl-prolyl cis-trans isomerase SurA
MSVRLGNAGLAMGLAMMLASAEAWSQAPVPQSATEGQAAPPTQPKQKPGSAASKGTVTASGAESMEPPVKPAEGVLVDQVIGVVNGDLVLESDVDEERRFEAFEPFSTPGSFSRERAIERLIDRTLILQQAKLQPDQIVSLDEAKAQVQTLRKDLPACKEYDCATEAGWEKFVHDQGFTMDELIARWQQRMEILKFIELRFRSGIEVTPEEIKAYYDAKMLPEYAKVKVTPPPLATISDRIQEVLLEEKVSSLLSDWLKQLKAQGSVRMMRPGEVQP